MKKRQGYAVEDEIAGSISTLVKDIDDIESESRLSLRALQMRCEIARLQALRVYAGVRSNPFYKEYFADESPG